MLLNFCATPDSVSVLYSMISRSVESEVDNHVPHQTGTHVEEHFSVDPSNRYCLPEFEPILHSSDQLIYIKRCRLQSKRLSHVSPGITYVLSNASNHPNAFPAMAVQSVFPDGFLADWQKLYNQNQGNWDQ